MGQLTNLYVSQSYQGLIKLANSTTGVTGTLQYTQDGLGNNLPIQISTSSVNITGSFTVNNLPIVAVDSSSLVTTASFNAFTSSIDGRVDALEVETGSLQLQINQKLDTGSFNSYTSSNDSKVNSLIASTGSYATTSSLAALSQSIALTDLGQNNRLTSIEGITGSLATTSSLTSLSQSIATTDLGQDNRLNSIESITGSLQNQINQKLDTGSFNSYTASMDARTGSYATTGSNNFVGQQNINGSVNVTGSLNVTGEITALSASITYLETIYQTSSVIFSSGSNILGDEAGDTQTLWGTVKLPSGPLSVTGSVTATNFTGSLQGTASYATNALSSSHAINADTASFVNSAVTSSISFDLVVNGKCDNPGGLTKGTIVRITGAAGDNPLFNSASWTDDFNSANTLGMLTANVAYNGFANIVVQGTVIGINTDNMTAGDLLYLSSSGQYTTSSVPAPYHEVRLGQVLRPQLNNGSAYISIDNGYELSELHDVDITSPVNGDLLVYRSGSYGQWVNETGAELGFATTSSVNRDGLITTGSIGGTQQITGSLGISGTTYLYGTTYLDGVNYFNKGNYFITESGSLAPSFIGMVSGSVIRFYGPANDNNSWVSTAVNAAGDYVIVNSNGNTHIADFNTSSIKFSPPLIISSSLLGNSDNDGQIRIFSKFFNDGTVKMNISSSNPSNQSNIIFGNPTGPATAQQTGSIVISGSNNIIMGGPRPNTLVTQGTYGYLGGNTNIFGGQSTLNTGSSYRPLMSSNLNFGTISMTLGSGSGNFSLNQNALIGGTLNLNMPSASIGGNMNTNIIAGTVTLQQPQAIPLASASFTPSFSTNNVNGTFNFQTNSGSFQVINNNINGTNVSVTSSYRATTVASNAITLNNNSINGLNHRILFDGVSTGTKGLSNNLIVGANNTASMVGNDTNGISNTGLIGQGLHVESGNISGTGGSLIVGRYNGTGSLANPGDIKFAVGTGNGDATRRTTLWVDTNSKVSVSGSFDVIGNTIMTGSLGVSGSLNVSGSSNFIGGGVVISGSQLRTNNFLIFNGSPSSPGTLDNFVGQQMVNRNAFVLNNIVQSQLSSGSNFTIFTDTGSNTTRQSYTTDWAGTQAKILVENINGSRKIELISDNISVTGSLGVSAGITGSLEGTASYATQALTASFALNGGGGGSIDTGSFATTGSNIFRGNQTLTGSFNQTGSMNVIGDPSNASATIARFGDPNYGVVDITGNGQLNATNQIGVTNIVNWNTGGATNITISNERNAIYLLPKTATGSVVIGKNQSSNIQITGSLLSPSITGSLEGTASYATMALTASFALNGGGGGSAFPFTGSAVITGSLAITGSASGNVNALSITSNTASLDLNNGNFFTLQLVSGSATHINPSNIKPGQTINILLSTTGSGTVNFPSSVKQISGSAYVPTTTTSKDIITLVSFDSTNLYLANVKNLI